MTEVHGSSILVSSIVFVVVFGGALAGMGLQQVLPENQLGAEAKDVIRLATGLLVTMTALVLGMLVSTANSSYQDRKNELAEMGSNFVLVDGLLASYGPESSGDPPGTAWIGGKRPRSHLAKPRIPGAATQT